MDTDHLAYMQKRHPSVLNRLAALRAGDRLVTSAVSLGELLFGVYLLPVGRRRRELLALYHQIIRQIGEVLPLTRTAAEKYAEVGAVLRKKGTMIPMNDVWIAAVALTRGAVLVTNDEHFRYVDNLRVENWTR